MEQLISKFIKAHSMRLVIITVSVIVVSIAATIILIQSGLDETIEILDSGMSNIPIIKNDDLQELGRVYSELNDIFEKEIDALVTGRPNRNNKINDELLHYGVYGQENIEKFKNDDYVNGVNIIYQKATTSIANGASNFNDIIATMAILYDQKMDHAEIEELKEVFTDLFWLSHTFTFESTELYPCRHGCASDTYKCTDVYTDYKTTRYLKFDPFTVRRHSDYNEYDPDNDFRIVYPKGECVVHGKSGGGCVWDENKVCYHGSGMTTIENCNLKVDIEETGESIVYGEPGEDYIPENINEKYLAEDPLAGQKLPSSDTTCYYYKRIRMCNTRKNLANRIRSLIIRKKNLEESKAKAEESWEKRWENSSNGPSESAQEAHDKQIRNYERDIASTAAEIEVKRSELDSHIRTECERNDAAKEFWCDGYKLCLGHKTHYTCNGHKVVLCLGHTSINVNVKILYKEELLKAILDDK